MDLNGDDTKLGATVVYDAASPTTDLTALRDRVDAFGGTLTIDISTDQTKITLQIPTTKTLEPA